MQFLSLRHPSRSAHLALISSTFTLQLDYTPKHTKLFLDQVHANAIGGFMPKTNSPDPNFGKCLQCAAVDRARYKVNPLLARSSFCTQCFQQYCFDPNNLTSSSALPNRKLNFVSPDPDELSIILGFLSRNKVPIILGFIGIFIGIAILCVFLYVYSGEPSGIWVDSDIVHLFSL